MPPDSGGLNIAVSQILWRCLRTYKTPPNMTMLSHTNCPFGDMVVSAHILNRQAGIPDKMNGGSMGVSRRTCLLDFDDSKVCFNKPKSLSELRVSKDAR